MAGELPLWFKLKPLTCILQSIITIVVVLGFMVLACIFLSRPCLTTPQAHGYATEEFEVTRERLGVYLPVRVQRICTLYSKWFSIMQVEHIDNPKGYGEGKDPREVDPGLRPVCIVTTLAI